MKVFAPPCEKRHAKRRVPSRWCGILEESRRVLRPHGVIAVGHLVVPEGGVDGRMKIRLIEPVLLELLTRAKLAWSIRIVNGLVPGNLSRALAGDPVGTVIWA
jgi:hypothetical protein